MSRIIVRGRRKSCIQGRYRATKPVGSLLDAGFVRDATGAQQTGAMAAALFATNSVTRQFSSW
ncbi:hypothetical protein Vi05172_g6671 [Venturia inaequalis]|nr:hypothetical protein Vi05172_g6671 [Venturia inaequalis]